jgi:hypothetical protein
MAPPVFEEVDDSDLDSISLTSTRSDIDEEVEYNVEKILAEDREEQGVVKYLVKWEGYPLHSSTWEPAEHLLSAEILPKWEKEKEEIRAGTRTPFDVNDYDEAQEDELEEKDKRHQRRVAKKRKLGIAVSRSRSISNGSANNVPMRDDPEDSEEDEPLANRQKRVKHVIPKRKGVASKVKKSLNRQVDAASSSSEESSDGEISDSGDSLLEESRGRQSRAANERPSASTGATSRTTAQPAAKGPPSNRTAIAIREAASKITKKASLAQNPSSTRKSAASSSSTHVKATDRPVLSSSARKSAPSTASFDSGNATAPKRLPILPTDSLKRKSIGNVSINFNPKPGPKVRKMSESDPRHQRFANLSEQNRFHKHSARKEGAPDTSMLATFNPATGRMEEPVATASRPVASTSHAVGGASVRAAPSVFGRREAPASTRQRSVSPSAPNAPATSTSLGDNGTPYRKVCWQWRNSKCTLPEGTCTFAHHYITCPFWRNGYCRLPERECQFDHCEGRDPVWFTDPGQVQTGRTVFPPSNITTRPPNSDQQPTSHQVSGMSPRQDVPSYEVVPSKRNSIPGPLAPHPRMTKPQENTVLYLKDITCRAWFAGYCPYAAATCGLAHRDTACHIDFKDVTCSFWADGKCNKSEDRCKFAHRNTEYRAGRPGSGKIMFMPLAADPANVIDAHPANGATTRQSEFQEPDPFNAFGSDSMVISEDSMQGVVNSPMDQTTTFKRPSLPVQRPVDKIAPVVDVSLTVRVDGDNFETTAKLACHTEQEVSMLTEILGSQRRLEISNVISADDLKRYGVDTLKQGARWPGGDFLVESSSKARLVEKLQFSCGAATSSQFTVLVYPAAVGVWKFLDTVGDANSQATLRFKVLPPLAMDAFKKIAPASNLIPVVPETGIDKMNGVSSPLAVKSLLNANMERLLKVSDFRKEERVFVMMPDPRASAIIVKAFEDRFKQPDYKGRDCKIWTSQVSGSWEICRASSACLVIVHPDVPLWEIPDLGKVLHSSSFRIFSIGFDPALATLNKDDPSFSCQFLFPMGDVVFLTDDLFINAPGKVLAIIERVNKSNTGKPDGATRNKIATRPGIKPWLLDLVCKQEQKPDPNLRTMMLEQIWKLCPIDEEDEHYPGSRSEKSDLISLAPEQLPTYQTLLEVDRKKATDYIVNWFAGWAFMNANKFRRFTVCHEEPGTGEPGYDKFYNRIRVGMQADPRGWANEFKYMLVQLPDQWVEWHDNKKATGGKKR